MPVSDVLAAALLQRLRRLNHAERAVLMRAAIIGRRFRFELLTATATLTEDRVRATLEKARTLQLIMPESSPGDWYAFRHALIRAVAYEEFLGTRVRPIHRRVVRALERCAASGEASLDDLAYHSWAAGDTARCVRYNELAGDQAVAAFAKDDAQTYYARARVFLAPGSDRHRRLTNKLDALGGDAPQAPGS